MDSQHIQQSTLENEENCIFIKTEVKTETFEDVENNTEDINSYQYPVPVKTSDILNVSQNTSKLLQEIDVEMLIELMRQQPCLWDSNSNDYSNRPKKNHAWFEVYTMLIQNYEELDKTTKDEKADEVQRKWRNLRTCFAREVAQQRKDKSGQSASTRRKYIYHDELSFLTPVILGDKSTSSNMNVEDVSSNMIVEDVSSNMNVAVENEKLVVDDLTDDEDQLRASTSRRSTKRKRDNTGVLDSLTQTLQQSLLRRGDNELQDDNKLFLLSLHKDMTEIPDHLKDSLKLELMQTVFKYKAMTRQQLL